jgi:hypothetical protein
MKKTIGFICPIIDETPHSSFIINYINQLSSIKPYMDFILFNSTYNRSDLLINKFGVLHLNEAKFFLGPMMAFDLTSMLFLKNCISNQKIFFDLDHEWTVKTNIENLTNNIDDKKFLGYFDLKDMYVTSNDLLVINDEEYKNLTDSCWKTSILIKDSEYEKIFEHIKI